MPSNRAAYLKGVNESPLDIRDAPYTPPGPGQVTIKNHAFAINPCDWLIQDTGMYVQQWPFILGCDVAGTIEEVGTDVTAFKPGNRVLASTQGVAGPPEQAGFQLYTLITADVVSKIPDSVSFEQACVLPLALLTVGTCFKPEHLGLEYPAVDAKDQGAYVFVWGGSASVGGTAVQLASGAGYKVIAAAGSKNKAYCEELGAEKVFDYNSETLVEDVIAYLKGKKLAGSLDSIAKNGTTQKVVQIAQGSEGSKRVVTVLPGTEQGHPEDIRVTSIFAELRGTEEAKKLFGDYVPKALESGKLKPKPEPFVVGKGLESLQEGMDKQKAGVSAAKVVVSL